MKGSARTVLRFMADAVGMDDADFIDELVWREWDRVSDGSVVRGAPLAPLAQEIAIPDCLEFGAEYRSTVGELRGALAGALPGRALTRVLYRMRCRHATVRRGSNTYAGWAGVRVRMVTAASVGGTGEDWNAWAAWKRT